jgi:hypothetical protein
MAITLEKAAATLSNFQARLLLDKDLHSASAHANAVGSGGSGGSGGGGGGGGGGDDGVSNDIHSHSLNDDDDQEEDDDDEAAEKVRHWNSQSVVGVCLLVLTHNSVCDMSTIIRIHARHHPCARTHTPTHRSPHQTQSDAWPSSATRSLLPSQGVTSQFKRAPSVSA